MSITMMMLLIVIVGLILLYLVGIKSGAKKKYKAIFILIGALMTAFGGYGLFVQIVSSFNG